ncbi:FAD dependent oxidoreductase [Mollisia scopiformis]|uniref:FAD dependent oxidoreductase n=1 Tax=Mollisia scopiformis TaxID=149040 RepID=A0A194XMP3_MOLSC|nr:FAD dependent oxidoreductase [Mollisia scopiformis]KUJ21530.1 FAD dependent oxidoreductase [Mollisia scopiformis]
MTRLSFRPVDPTASKPFPVANATLPYWRTEHHEIDSHRSTEDLPTECDVLIIGSGLAGASTAYFLTDDNPSPPRIVMLEAREVCSGATGRNGGHCSMGSPAFIDSVIQKHGPEAAKELFLFTAAQIYAMKHVVEKEKIDCDYMLDRFVETFLNQSDADNIKETYEAQLKAGLDYINDVDIVNPKYVEKITGIKGAKTATSVTGAQLWPYKLVSSLLARILEKGCLNLQTHTPVHSVSVSPKGISIVNTPRGSIRAGKVVFATNAYTSGILPLYADKIIPTKGTNSHISVPKDTKFPPPHLNFTYGITYEPPQTRDYLIPRPDGGVICGGAKHTFYDAKELWWGNFDDSTLFPMASTRDHFETVMQDNFVGWEKSGAKVDRIWTGIMGNTADSFPHVGQVPGQPNHFILAGFNGSGMSMIFLTAKGVAKMVRDDVAFEESGIPRLFKTTESRLKLEVKP